MGFYCQPVVDTWFTIGGFLKASALESTFLGAGDTFTTRI